MIDSHARAQMGTGFAVIGRRWRRPSRLRPGLIWFGFDLITPTFAVIIIVVIAEVFREGARLRRESELTI